MTTSDMRQKSLQSGAITLSSQGAQFILHMGMTIVLARLLLPSDYGLMAMVASVTALAHLFSDTGLSVATIQSKAITHEQVSALFWINIAVGALLTLAVCALAPLAAWFYGEPRLTALMMGSSLTFLLGGFGIQHSALLMREARFGAVAIAQIGGMLGGGGVGIIMAWGGYGPWALVGVNLVVRGVNSLLLYSQSGWVPGIWRYGSGIRSLVHFGAHIAGFNVINYFARNLDNVLIGRYVGADALGFYSKAYRLLMLPITNLRAPLTRAAMPFLSRLQDEPERYRRYLCRMVAMLAALTFPLVAFLALFAHPIIGLLLGERWLPVVPLFQILAIAGIIQPVATTVYGLIPLTLGRGRRYLIFGVMNSAGTVLFFILGIPWGAMGVATAYAVSNYVLLFPLLFYTLQGTSVRCRDLGQAVFRPSVATLAVVAVAVGIINLTGWPALVQLAIGVLACPVVYLASWLILPGGWKEVRGYALDMKGLLVKPDRQDASAG